MSKVKVTGNEM